MFTSDRWSEHTHTCMHEHTHGRTHAPICLGRASNQPMSMPLDMARLTKVRNLMLLSLMVAFRALMGWKMSLSMDGDTSEQDGSLAAAGNIIKTTPTKGLMSNLMMSDV